MQALKIGVLFLNRKRPGFDPQWGAMIQGKVTEYLQQGPLDVHIVGYQVVDDITMGQACEECARLGVTAMMVLQPTISDGNLSLSLARLWKRPVVLWATPTRQTGPEIASNSLVGTHIAASFFGQIHHPYEILYGMPGDEGFDERFRQALGLVHAGTIIGRARMGLVGYHCPGYINVQTDAVALYERLGVQLFHTGMTDLFNAMEGCDAAAVAEDIKKVEALNFPLRDLKPADLDVASRYYIAMNAMMDEHALDALAVRCWPECCAVTGQWPYLAFARMLSEGRIAGCEGDIDGALSCLLANLAGIGPSYLSDWLEHDTDTITTWHTGNSFFDILDPVGSEFGPAIARHFNNGKPAVVEGRMTPDRPVTIFRVWLCDHRYKIAAFEAQTIEPRRHLKGTNGLVRVDGLDPRDLFDELCHEGMPHHIAIIQGHHARTLRRMARLLGMQWIGYGV